MDSPHGPVADLILHGEAATVDEAEEIYLDRHIEDVVRLVESTLSDDDSRRHPLIALLLSRGSRGFEDSCDVRGAPSGPCTRPSAPSGFPLS